MQPTAYTPAQLPERIASKIRVDPESGCWVWVASLRSDGYGRVSWQSSMQLAHRVVYSLLIGDPGPVLDHRCFNHACVNPEHLRPVTYKQNQEHRQGAQLNSKSGVRGVNWAKREQKWIVTASNKGKKKFGGYFTDLAEAEQAAIALRARLFTHDDSYFK